MADIVILPQQQRVERTLDPDPAPPSPEWGRVARGVTEWVMASERLDRAEHGIALEDIRRVEAFWSDAEVGFSSAGFVLLLNDGSRRHLQCALDEANEPDIAAVAVEPVPAGYMLPGFDCTPLGGWSTEVDAFNVDLLRMQRGNDD